jgi:uncharacterized sulfatase
MHGAYHDIDPGPTRDLLLERHDDPAIRLYFHLAVDRRPAEELYDIVKDPGCLHNLAGVREYGEVTRSLRAQLLEYLTRTDDPRVVGGGEVIESYDWLSGPMRTFPRSD